MPNGKLILIRHGQTAWARDGFYTGRTNLPLTELGQAEAIAARKNLYDINSKIVFVSPLKRAQQTAQLIGLVDYITEPLIQEMDYGPAEGRSVSEMTKAKTRYWGKDKGLWNLFNDGVFFGTAFLGAVPEDRIVFDEEVDEKIKVSVLSGETIQEVAGRAQRMIYKVLPHLYKGQDVVLVAHAHFLRFLTSQWLEIHPKKAESLFLNTASVSILKLGSNGEKFIYAWNRTPKSQIVNNKTK
ncbi:MAG: histidine phosphatase family protein [Bifidobacteriaceae bacterium]|jgi:probable phosphoglycerate mutase|nr:histidine phosphatase family protein [Bifidobacteriaceae bacterium]